MASERTNLLSDLQLRLQRVIHLVHFTDFLQEPIWAEEFRTGVKKDTFNDFVMFKKKEKLTAVANLCFFMVRL